MRKSKNAPRLPCICYKRMVFMWNYIRAGSNKDGFQVGILGILAHWSDGVFTCSMLLRPLYHSRWRTPIYKENVCLRHRWQAAYCNQGSILLMIPSSQLPIGLVCSTNGSTGICSEAKENLPVLMFPFWDISRLLTADVSCLTLAAKAT